MLRWLFYPIFVCFSCFSTVLKEAPLLLYQVRLLTLDAIEGMAATEKPAPTYYC